LTDGEKKFFGRVICLQVGMAEAPKPGCTIIEFDTPVKTVSQE
jgi:hypothetical protein